MQFLQQELLYQILTECGDGETKLEYIPVATICLETQRKVLSEIFRNLENPLCVKHRK